MSAQQARERKKNYVQTLEERNQLQVRSNHPGSCMCKPIAVLLPAEESKQGRNMCFCIFCCNLEGRAHWRLTVHACRQGSSHQAALVYGSSGCSQCLYPNLGNSVDVWHLTGQACSVPTAYSFAAFTLVAGAACCSWSW